MDSTSERAGQKWRGAARERTMEGEDGLKS